MSAGANRIDVLKDFGRATDLETFNFAFAGLPRNPAAAMGAGGFVSTMR